MHHARLQRRRFIGTALGAAGLAAVGAHAAADDFPNQPLRLVVTFGAGGISDIVTRMVAAPLALELGQPVVVENRPGASGAIGARFVAQAAADGHTLLAGTPSTQVINPMIYARPGYDPWQDFAPLSLVSEAPVVMATRPGLGTQDLPALVERARADPGGLSFASAGIGTTPHLAMAMFQMATGTRLVHVPFKSGGEAVNAVVGGQVDLLVEAATVVAPFAMSGQLVALCAAGPRRCAALPTLATAAELGLPGFRVTAPWVGIAAPSNVPAHRRALLAAALTRTLAQPELRARLLERGVEPLPTGPVAYAQLLRDEQRDWERVVRAAEVRAG